MPKPTENTDDGTNETPSFNDGNDLAIVISAITDGINFAIDVVERTTASLRRNLSERITPAATATTSAQSAIQKQIIAFTRDATRATEPGQRSAAAQFNDVADERIHAASRRLRAITFGTEGMPGETLRTAAGANVRKQGEQNQTHFQFAHPFNEPCPPGWHNVRGFNGELDDLCVKDGYLAEQPRILPRNERCPAGFREQRSSDPSKPDLCVPDGTPQTGPPQAVTPGTSGPTTTTPPTVGVPSNTCQTCGGSLSTPPPTSPSGSQCQPCCCCAPQSVGPFGQPQPPQSLPGGQPAAPAAPGNQPVPVNQPPIIPDEQPPEDVPFPTEPLGQPHVPFQCAFDVYATSDSSVGTIDVGTQPTLSEIFIPKPDDTFSLLDLLSPGDLFAKGILSAIQAFGKPFFDTVQSSLNTILSGMGCVDLESVANLTMANLIGFLERWVSEDLHSLRLPFSYNFRKDCPTAFPGSDAAIEAFLSNDIDFRVAASWANINNDCTDPWSKVLRARRNRPNHNELAAMRHRKIITAPDYFRKMRENGFIEGTDQTRLFEISKPLPPLSELIRYMVRDTADANLVNKFNLDAEFGNKFKGDIKDWAEKQGIDENIMVNSWRAHWNIPGPSQLYEMFHRLRPNKNDGNPVVTRETIKEALQQQDILPFWIEPLLAVSFRTLTRVDLRRAFDIGAVDEPQMLSFNQDLGYSPTDAKTLTDFAIKQKAARIWTHRALRFWKAEATDRETARRTLQKARFRQEDIAKALDLVAKTQRNHSAVKLFRSGCIDRKEAFDRLVKHGLEPDDFDEWLDNAAACKRSSPSLSLYRGCVIDRMETERRLKQEGFPDAKIAELLDDIDAEITAKSRKGCVDNLIERLKLGEFDFAQLQIELDLLGVPPHCRDGIIQRAVCEFNARGRMPSTQQLCSWLEMGIINAADMLIRLENIGWRHDNALNILRDCMGKIFAKNLKRADGLARQGIKAAEQDARKKAIGIRKADAMTKTAAKNLERARLAQEKREKALVKAADKLRKTLNIELVQAIDLAKDAIKIVRDEFPLAIDQTYIAVIQAIEKLDADGPETLIERAMVIAQTFVDLPLGGEPQNGQSLPSTNGEI